MHQPPPEVHQVTWDRLHREAYLVASRNRVVRAIIDEVIAAVAGELVEMGKQKTRQDQAKVMQGIRDQLAEVDMRDDLRQYIVSLLERLHRAGA